MPLTPQNLVVFAHLESGWAPAGRLTLNEEDTQVVASSFAYGTRYIERPDALEVDPVSLSLNEPDQARNHVLVPANGLPLFGGIRDAAPDSWGRRVIEAKLKAPANTLPESEYLLHAGSDRVGALDVRRELTDEPRPGLYKWESLQYLQDAAARIEEGGTIPAELEVIFDGGTALGGARPKASVRDEDHGLWLAKFTARRDAFSIPAVEKATLDLARRCELMVPEVRTVDVAGQEVMLIRRFDRYWALPGDSHQSLPTLIDTRPGRSGSADGAGGEARIEKRLHFISGLTLLGCDESESPTKSYADLAQAARTYCHASVIRSDNRELFTRMVFNIFVSNNDDHLRNHGYVFDPALRGWRLSPLYDVLPTPSLASERLLHLGVGHEGRLATLDNAMSGRDMFTLSRATAGEIIGRVWSVVRGWKTGFEADGVSAQDIDKAGTAFRHIDDISTAELRKALP
ncbi:MAG: HipA domain-containing protein [Betaproteobacteria bacterium]